MNDNQDDTIQRINDSVQDMLPKFREIIGLNVAFCGFVWSGKTCYFVRSDNSTDAEAVAIIEGMLKLWGVKP